MLTGQTGQQRMLSPWHSTCLVTSGTAGQLCLVAIVSYSSANNIPISPPVQQDSVFPSQRKPNSLRGLALLLLHNAEHWCTTRMHARPLSYSTIFTHDCKPTAMDKEEAERLVKACKIAQLPQYLLINFLCRWTMASVVTYCIRTWYSGCKPENTEALQPQKGSSDHSSHLRKRSPALAAAAKPRISVKT